MPLTKEQKKLFARKDYEVWKRTTDHEEDLEMVLETDNELEAYTQATIKNQDIQIQDRASFFYAVSVIKNLKMFDDITQRLTEDDAKNSK